MPIKIVCPHGHRLTANAKLAGKRVKCPKCRAVVKIPDAEQPEIEDGLVLDDLPGPIDESHVVADKPRESAAEGSESAGASRSLDGGGSSPNAPPASRFAAMPGESARVKRRQPTTLGTRLDLVIGLAGAAVALLVFALIGWFLFGRKTTNNVATVAPPAPVAAASEHDPPVDGAVDPVETAALAPVLPVSPWEPARLTPIQLDERLRGFALPGLTWAAAYDETTGRLALSNDDFGVLVFDLDDIAQGQLEPTGGTPTNSRVSAICLKALPDQRVFVVASEDSPQLQLIDVESLDVAGELPLEELNNVSFLAGSPNPKDPFVYFIDDEHHLSRIDILTGKQAGRSKLTFADVVVSANGGRIHARPNTTADGVSGDFDEVINFGGDRRRYPIGGWPRNFAPSPPVPLVDGMAVDNGVLSASMRVLMARLDFSPGAAFLQRPLLIGLGREQAEVVFASANNYRRLASIPLPHHWRRDRRKSDPRDFRLRHSVSPTLQSGFLDIRADDKRGLGIMTLNQHLVLAPQAKANLPNEPSLAVRRTFPARVTVGEMVEWPLSGEKATRFEFVGNAKGVPNGNHIRLLSASPKPAPRRNSLSLAAAINDQQRVLFMSSLDDLSGLELPFDIRVGDEQMTVTAVDDFKTSLTVSRPRPSRHGVSSDVQVMGNGATPATPSQSPVVEGRKFRWTPSAEQLGRQTIRMRARSGGIAHEWYWDVIVEQGAANLPFQVVGVEPEPGGDRAVVWGQRNLPYLNARAADSVQANVYYIGIYDLTRKQLLRHVEVPQPIMSATLHRTGVYATMTAFDIEPKRDRSAENLRVAASRRITPTEVVRLDRQTLAIADRAATTQHCKRLQVIGDRYLAAAGRWRGEVQRFHVPQLNPVEPAILGYEYSCAGRTRDGWVWDGIVWDGPMKKPKLLLFPLHFERPPGAHSPAEMKAALGGVIRMQPQGPFVCTWFPINQQPAGHYQLKDHPVGLSCTGGFLRAHSWSAPSLSFVGDAPRPTAVRLLDLTTVQISGSRFDQERRAMGYVAEADGQIHVALLGQLYSVPVKRLVRPQKAFRFVEQQDRFVLPVGQKTKVRYSAPGAVNYHFQLWRQRPHFHDEDPVISTESADGVFELDLQESNSYVQDALAATNWQPVGGLAKDPLERVENYLKRITPVYQSLTGAKPRGVPFPIYVSVIAEHQDGKQKAGLAHSYLIEVPLQQVRDALTTRSPR